MGGCRRGNYRGVLAERGRQNQAGITRVKAEAFSLIKRGDKAAIDRLIQLVRDNPGLINAQSDEPHKATLLISAVFEIQHTPKEQQAASSSMFTRTHANPNQEKIAQLLRFINTILDNPVHYSLDVASADKDNNTLLHRIFWLAIQSDPDLSKKMTDSGIKIFRMLHGASEFRKILAIKNNYGQNFLQNLYIEGVANVNQAAFNAECVNNVKARIAPELDSFKARSGSATTTIDFADKSFRDRLEELLTDNVSFDVMQNPVLLVTEGHTFDAATWENVTKNPNTNNEFDVTNLKENKLIKDVIAVFNRNLSDAETCSQIQGLFATVTRATVTRADVTSTDNYAVDITANYVQELVNAYALSLRPVAAAAVILPQQTQLAGIAATIAANLKQRAIQMGTPAEVWETSNTAEKTKYNRLISLANCLNSSLVLSMNELTMAMGLIKATCAQSNSSSFWKPITLTEFETVTANLGLAAQDIGNANLGQVINEFIQSVDARVRAQQVSNTNNQPPTRK